jgi:hypothetical protein
MKIKKVRRSIREQLRGQGESNFAAVSMMHNYAQEAFSAGQQTDADAIAIFVTSDDNVHVALLIGKSMLFGSGIKEYLFDYHNQVEKDADHCVEWLTDNAVDELKKESNFIAVLRDNESERWRGFRGDLPLSIDEIKVQAQKYLN